MQMVANNSNNEGLFRSGIMQSGSPIPVGDMSGGQKYYDAIVAQTGCSTTLDTLVCLCTVPYATLKAAVDASLSIFSYQVIEYVSGDYVLAYSQRFRACCLHIYQGLMVYS